MIHQSARRAGKSAVIEAAIRDALAKGIHTHEATRDGTKCHNQTCPEDEHGYVLKEATDG